MKYNVLYGILLGGAAPEVSSVYYKRYTPSMLTDLGMNIVSRLLPSDKARRPVFACTVCAYALDTCFGSQILELDANNTYNKPVRPQDCLEDVTADKAKSHLMYDLTAPVDSMRWLLPMLDKDISEQLVAPQWIELAAAAGLQLLREAY